MPVTRKTSTFETTNSQDYCSEQELLSISQLICIARQRLESGMPLCVVRGEISNISRPASGHLYFVLKDEKAQVRCTMWRNRSQLLGWHPEDGQLVDARVLVTIYEARGEFQLNVEHLVLCGQGEIYVRFLRTRDKLAAEGLFDPDRRRDLPFLPRCIALVTSLHAAALADITNTLHRRAPHITLYVFPTAVQGAGAARDIASALALAGDTGMQLGCELVILCRGGGSAEDLAVFNEEVVARAIRACELPVVSGIGHETDFSIADFAADLRAPTPTAAAELVCPPRVELLQSINTWRQRLDSAVYRKILTCVYGKDRLAAKLRTPAYRLEDRRKALLILRQRLRSCVTNWRARLNEQLQNCAARLHLLNPNAVLKRGYCLTYDANDKLVCRAEQLSTGNQIKVQFSSGKADAQVITIYADSDDSR